MDVALAAALLLATLAVVFRKEIKEIIVTQIISTCNEILKYEPILRLATRIVCINSARIDTGARVKWFEFNMPSGRVFIPLPYDRRKKSVTISLVYKDGDTRDINYPRGVPFYCTALDIGCEKIVVKDINGIVSEYTEGDCVVV